VQDRLHVGIVERQQHRHIRASAWVSLNIPAALAWEHVRLSDLYVLPLSLEIKGKTPTCFTGAKFGSWDFCHFKTPE